MVPVIPLILFLLRIPQVTLLLQLLLLLLLLLWLLLLMLLICYYVCFCFIATTATVNSIITAFITFATTHSALHFEVRYCNHSHITVVTYCTQFYALIRRRSLRSVFILFIVIFVNFFCCCFSSLYFLCR